MIVLEVLILVGVIATLCAVVVLRSTVKAQTETWKDIIDVFRERSAGDGTRPGEYRRTAEGTAASKQSSIHQFHTSAPELAPEKLAPGLKRPPQIAGGGFGSRANVSVREDSDDRGKTESGSPSEENDN